MTKKHNRKELAEIVDTEGLDYALLHYISPESIKSKKLRELWEQARDLLLELQEELGIE
jgi:sugar phosphate isomerase/epimerase